MRNLQKHLLSASAIILACAGLIALFFPDIFDIGDAIGSKTGHLFIQTLAAYWLALAALNWLTRGATIGGIYGRPVVIANLVAYFVTAMNFLRYVETPATPLIIWIMGTTAIAMSIFFGLTLLGNPVKPE